MLNNCPTKATERNLSNKSSSFQLKYSTKKFLCLKSTNAAGTSDTLVPNAS